MRSPFPQLLSYIAVSIKRGWNEPRLRGPLRTELDRSLSRSTGDDESETWIVGQQVDESATERAVTPDNQNFQRIRQAADYITPRLRSGGDSDGDAQPPGALQRLGAPGMPCNHGAEKHMNMHNRAAAPKQASKTQVL
jgi:hypothetical protein